MKAVVDDKIPYIREAIEGVMDCVVYLPGNQISRSDLLDADVLIVRTRTRVDEALLEGTPVRFVATATIGFDHIDAAYLERKGITWTNCPGCNATSVAQYVKCSLLLLEREHGIRLSQTTLGIVGVGHVGSAVSEAVAPLVGRVLLNDPPRHLPATLAQLQQECDIITIHTPLTTEGHHPTYHLFDEAFFRGLPHPIVLLNAGRGEVVDNAALEQAIDSGMVRHAIIDTWEHEPNIRLSLLPKVYIATPHIAGYSADGKANASRMVMEALCRWMGRPMTATILPPEVDITGSDPLDLYNPLTDSERLKMAPQDFELQRGHYPVRREKGRA